MHLLWLALAIAHPKFDGNITAVATASDAPVIAFVVGSVGGYHVWISRDDGATTVYSLARTEGAHVRRAPITSRKCHSSCDPKNHALGCDLSSGCRFDSALGVVETSQASGPLDVDLVDGSSRLRCDPEGAAHALVTCSTRTRLAFVEATSCPGVAPQSIQRLELVLVGRGTDTSTKTEVGELTSTNPDGTVWTYHFDPDIDLIVTTGPRPAVSLQVAGTPETCLAFTF
ncbi:MAG: hypothetical protein E6J90_32875 [Deltaproteobacteria bacterium]|nr:MAG: hypothetical protein E6J90_32875 [Deltaproteobacteria bacterium]TMQ23306.1 MAG: hypothetical protein E6J91_00300 [Deltaproteobacteria bacterium]